MAGCAICAMGKRSCGCVIIWYTSLKGPSFPIAAIETAMGMLVRQVTPQDTHTGPDQGPLAGPYVRAVL